MTTIQAIPTFDIGDDGQEKPQLLMLTHRVPFPPDRGDRIRSWNILRHLSRNADVSLACVSSEPIHPQAKDAFKEVCRRVVIAEVGNRSRWVRACASMAFGRSLTEGLFWSPSLASTLDHWADVLPFDAALVYCSSMMQYACQKSLAKVPRVVDLVDVDSQKWQDYANRSPLWKRLVYQLESRRVRRLEQEISRSANAVTLASDAEAMLFRDSVSGNEAVVLGISNGVDIDFFDPSTIERVLIPNRPKTSSGVSRFRMVFVGVLDYLPNVDGLKWFINQVWAKLKELIPAATLEIVGRNPSSALKKLLEREGIRVVGSVDDVRPYLAGADLVIAPLLIARGIQNKVLEAMAMGKPVLATSYAAEGIDAERDKHFVVADSAAEWIQALVRLFNRPELQDRIGAAARKLILEEYTWPSRLDRLNVLLGIANT